MTNTVNELAFAGKWVELLPILNRAPELVRCPSEPKGYTVLHQAAWHGASPNVIGELLALGADRGLRTRSKGQTAQDIAIEKHVERKDLNYLLSLGRRSLAQLMRKAVAENHDFFHEYDGNQIICDRMIECFGLDTYCHSEEELDTHLAAAFTALTGVTLSSSEVITCGPKDSNTMSVDTRFWNDRFLPTLRSLVNRSHVIPIENEWAVVADLFDPPPEQWGLRGSLFLWLEMRQALCHVEIPEGPDALARILAAAFESLTGTSLEAGREFSIKRFSRGGMSGGWISREWWREELIPLLQNRLVWLQQSWRY